MRTPLTLLESNPGTAIACALFTLAGAALTAAWCTARIVLELAAAEDVGVEDDDLDSEWTRLLLRGAS